MIAQTNWDAIVSNSELTAEARYRASLYEVQKVHAGDEDGLISKGWEIIKTSKNGKILTLRRQKRVGDAFEDRVWTMFKKLGFKALNKGRTFTIWISDSKHKQIDVFAVDDDVVIFVECKATEIKKASNFKTDIEAMNGLRSELTKKALEHFPDKKVCFIWAMGNYYESQADHKRLADARFIDFQDDDVAYFSELATHLGPCAKYQLLARLFATDVIDDFDDRVPAIRSQFGQYTCYTFAIEPERLLKIGYILHHHSSNDSMMPTYQRLIKKTRLSQIRNFIEKGGYFANSLLISIDSHGKGLAFDKKSIGLPNSLSDIGILHLPNQYSSAYIIDGQHRLYAYSGSTKGMAQTIPVVAFVDLDQHEQLKLFMDINENQKSVPKGLRVTLNADMLWDAQNPDDRRSAIASHLAQQLNDSKSSKLRGRIIIGENEKAPERTTTVNAVQDAIYRSGMLSGYKKNGVLEHEGSLDFDNNEKTASRVLDLLTFCFDHIQEACQNAWLMTEEDATIVVTGRGIHAIIHLIGDIVAHLKNHGSSPKTMDVEDLIQDVDHYLDPLCDYINSCTEEERKDLRRTLGGNSYVKFWRQFQKVVRDRFSEFNPPGLDDYLLNETRQFNDAAKSMIDEITEKVKEVVFIKFLSNFSSDKQLIQFPRTVYNRIEKEQSQYAYDHGGDKPDYRQFLVLGDLQKLAVLSRNWTTYFESELTPPWIAKKEAKTKKTEWMTWLSDMSNKLSMSSSAFSVSESDHQKVAKIYKWLLGDKKA